MPAKMKMKMNFTRADGTRVKIIARTGRKKPGLAVKISEAGVARQDEELRLLVAEIFKKLSRV